MFDYFAPPEHPDAAPPGPHNRHKNYNQFFDNFLLKYKKFYGIIVASREDDPFPPALYRG